MSVVTPPGISPPRKWFVWGQAPRPSKPSEARPSLREPLFYSTTAACGAFSRPYTKKKNAASARKNSVKPNIFASYRQTEVICLAGKNRSEEHTSELQSRQYL